MPAPAPKPTEKIAFVCQRYGVEVNGGAEQYCRVIAEQLSARYDVSVYTTCALDYLTWSNYYDSGESTCNGVHVKRYATRHKRGRVRLSLLSRTGFLSRPHIDLEERLWVDAQGPYCPNLIRALRNEGEDYKAVFFVTYLYYPAVRGLGLGLNNAVLVPTVHDEPPVYLRCYNDVFAHARAIAWNTPEERSFAVERFPFVANTPSEMTGIGVQVPSGPLPDIPAQIQNVPYLVYAGRIDESKGCGDMFAYFQRYKREHPGTLKLVLMGKAVLAIPDDPDIVHLGFVSEETKFAVMERALALVLFSHYESLSIVVLESMAMGRPVVVSGQCDVLVGHCRRSGAGLYFNNYQEFAAALDRMRENPQEYESMCTNAQKYVNRNYSWGIVLDAYESLIQLFD